ncbi:MAG: hypothetical protein AABX52_02805 [Nanoarchaeota archaeon]
MKHITTLFTTTWNTMTSSWKLLLTSMLIDAIYTTIFALILTTTFTQIFGSVQNMYTIMGNTPQLNLTNTAELNTLIQENQTFLNAYNHMMQWIIIFLLGIFITWTLFQGIAWYITHYMCKHKLSTKTFATRFLIITSIASIIGIIGLYTISILSTIGLATLISPNIISYITLAWIATCLYLCFFAYAQILHTTSITNYYTILTKHWKQSLFAYILALLFITTSNWILMQLYSTQPILMYLFMLFIALPLYTYNRIMIVQGSE